MNWQVQYALKNLREDSSWMTAQHVGGDVINIKVPNQPDVTSVISGARKIDQKMAELYFKATPNMDFLCGYRTECVWNGAAIRFLTERNIGWGSFGTLASAAADGKANVASHKVFAYAEKILRQTKSIVKDIDREYDRVFLVKVKSGRTLRIGLISDYEPTADVVRTFWDGFDAVDVMWNINPNGNPTLDAIEAGKELGCKVMKWDDLKDFISKA